MGDAVKSTSFDSWTRSLLTDLASRDRHGAREMLTAVAYEFERLQLRVRRLELEGMSFSTTERHEIEGEAIAAERERAAEAREAARKCREELAAVNARLAGWGL